jgi:AraC-like DNA-binding protein
MRVDRSGTIVVKRACWRYPFTDRHLSDFGNPCPLSDMWSPMPSPALDFPTNDPDEFAERISAVAPNTLARRDRPGELRARVRAWTLPGVALFSVAHRNLQVLSPGTETFYSITRPRVGGVDVLDAKELQPLPVGTLHVLDPLCEFTLRTGERSGETLVANIDRALIERHAVGARGRRPNGPLLASRLDRKRAGSLRRYLEFLWDELQRDDTALASPLLASQVVDTIAALAVDAARLPHPGEAPLERPLLTLAEEYLAAHLSEPVSAGDLAASLGVSARSLSRAFHAQHGMGPMGFLRERRFEAARRALVAARRESVTVTQIAHLHGFMHLGRFSVGYRRRFGESPSAALRR